MYKLSKTNVSNLIVNSSIDCWLPDARELMLGIKPELGRVLGSHEIRRRRYTATQCQEPAPKSIVILAIVIILELVIKPNQHSRLGEFRSC